ncbi:ParB N-terminal domain-containing protein, partial [candidate division KSB1 bacterium]|nr:ParB N-terminal domain-containing protein [candidate division KSB1 bacterium]RQW03990.1 MAG: hypothetical protein EH222_11790 [candidate division KSB1 bacterium]
MKVAIDDIVIRDRIRMDEGDIEELAQSISQIGLIQPIVISEEYELLSGYRRLHACKTLGWETIEVKIVTVGENPLKKIEWEYHENIGRKELTEDEKQAYVHKRESLIKPTPKGFWLKIKAFFMRVLSSFRRKKVSVE